MRGGTPKANGEQSTNGRAAESGHPERSEGSPSIIVRRQTYPPFFYFPILRISFFTCGIGIAVTTIIPSTIAIASFSVRKPY